MMLHYKKILADAEKRASRSLEIQIKQEGAFQGGFLDNNGLVAGKFSIYRVTTAIAVYCNEESALYHDAGLYQMIKAGLSYIERCQHDTGRFDFISCNFDSAPDTAFCIKRLLPVLHYLEANRKTEEEELMWASIREIVRKGAGGILTGGFHTPNHRWAIASNLMECGKYFQDEELIRGAEKYLVEGIDCNEDGEFAEKSSGNYNRINNDAMITLAETTGDDRYYEYAVRNLKMMLTYLEPDGSIFTANSTRQDNGKVIYPRDYYLEYLTVGYRRQIPEFLDAANAIFQTVVEKQMMAPDCLIHMMNHPELKTLEHEGCSIADEYHRFYQGSGIVRARRGAYGYTVMKDKSGFLYVSGQKLRIQMKVCGGFFEHRSFCPAVLEKQEQGYHLEQEMKAWYYLPFKEYQGTADWWEMDQTKREKIGGVKMTIGADVAEVEGGLDVHIKASGVEGAPFRVEIETAGGQWLWSDSVVMAAEAGKETVIRKGIVSISNSEETIEIGPAFGTHMYTEGLFGSEAHSKHAFTLLFTDYTEFDRTIQIRYRKGGMMLV